MATPMFPLIRQSINYSIDKLTNHLTDSYPNASSNQSEFEMSVVFRLFVNTFLQPMSRLEINVFAYFVNVTCVTECKIFLEAENVEKQLCDCPTDRQTDLASSRI